MIFNFDSNIFFERTCISRVSTKKSPNSHKTLLKSAFLHNAAIYWFQPASQRRLWSHASRWSNFCSLLPKVQHVKKTILKSAIFLISNPESEIQHLEVVDIVDHRKKSYQQLVLASDIFIFIVLFHLDSSRTKKKTYYLNPTPTD